MSEKYKKLDELVKKGLIKSYCVTNISEDGVPDAVSKFRNTEQLVLEFTMDDKLTIDTFCSGMSENTTLFIS